MNDNQRDEVTRDEITRDEIAKALFNENFETESHGNMKIYIHDNKRYLIRTDNVCPKDDNIYEKEHLDANKIDFIIFYYTDTPTYKNKKKGQYYFATKEMHEKNVIVKGKQIHNCEEGWYETLEKLKKALDFYKKMNEKEDKNNMTTQEEIEKLIVAKAKQIILTGAPGTGKTYIAKKIAKEKGTDLTWKNEVNGEYPKYEFVQFHPSYDYTDFVEGLRPVEDENGEIKFQKVDGIFKKFCREVVNAKNKEGKYFFIIDEINRADLSKVFGELMYCLESDKRGADNKIQTQYANLPTYNPKTKSKYEPDTKDKNKSDTNEDKYNLDVFADGFYIPENVYIIGTMNDIDRSVESMDFALRRRFIWKEIKVPENIAEVLQDMFKMEEGLKDKDTDFIKDFAESIAKYIEFVNDKIKARPGLNEQYCISQGQFANIPSGDAETTAETYIKQVWDLRLRSLLYEYVRGEGKEEDFVESCSYEKYKKSPEKSSDNKNQSSGDQNND